MDNIFPGIRVPITLDTTGFEAGIKKTVELADQGLNRVAAAARQMINNVDAGTKAGFDAYQTHAQAFSDSLRAQEEAARKSADTISRVSSTYASGAKSFQASFSAYQAANSEAGKAAAAYAASVTQTKEYLTNLGTAFSLVSTATRSYATNLREASLGFIEVLPGVKALDHALEHFGLSLEGATKFAAGAALFAAMADGIKEALDFEAAFNKVEMSVSTAGESSEETAEKFEALKHKIHEISAETGTAATTLASIAAMAGKLGLQSAEDITKFTDTMAKLSIVTGASGTGLASAFGKLALQMDESLENADRMGSSLIALASTSRATEAQILDMSTTIGGLGRFIGLTTAQVMGLSTAFAAVGAQPMAVNRMLFEMNKAVKESTGTLELFAAVAGKTSKEFQQLFNQNSGQAIAMFFEGLGRNSAQASQILQRLGLDSQISAKSMVMLGQAAGETDKSVSLLTEKLGLATKSWEENTDLQTNFQKAVSDTWSQLKILGAQVQMTLVTAFEGALPVIKAIVAALNEVMKIINEHPEWVKFAGAVTMIGAAFLGLNVALGLVGLAWAGVVGGLSSVAGTIAWVLRLIVGSEGLTIAITALRTAVLALGESIGLAFMAMGPVGWVTVGLGTVAAAMYLFVTRTEAGAAAWEKFKRVVGGKVTTEDARNDLLTMLENVEKVLADRAKGGTGKIGEEFDGWAKGMGVKVRQFLVDTSEEVNSLKDLLTDEQRRALTRDIADTQGRTQRALAEMATERQRAVVFNEMTERQALESVQNTFKIREDAAKRIYGDEIRLARDDYKNRAELIDKANEKYKNSTAEIQRDRVANQIALHQLDIKEFDSYNKLMNDKVAATKAAQATLDSLGLSLDKQLRQLGMTDTQKTLDDYKSQYEDTMKKVKEVTDVAEEGTLMYAEALRRAADAEKLLKGQTEELLTRGLKPASAELLSLTGQLGKNRDEAALVAASWTHFKRAFEDLSPAEQEQAKKLAQTSEELRKLKIATDTARLALDLYWSGLSAQAAARQAQLAMAIEEEQKYLDVQIKTLETINNSRQVYDQKYGQLLKDRGQFEGDFFKFSLGVTRKYMADQDTLWQGWERMLVNTFGNAQRALSDVFFNVFTRQSFKLKDVFKDLLNSIIRDLSNFLASAAVKGFLAFMTNLLSGQSAGTAASGALGSLLGTQTGGAGGGQNVAAGGSAVGSMIDVALKALGYTPKSQTQSTTTTGPGTGLPTGNTTSFTTPGPPPSIINPGGDTIMTRSGPVPIVFGTSTYTGGTERLQNLYIQPTDVGEFTSPWVSSFTSDYTTPNMASGGRVPGAGRGDTVPAMLEPGEFVVRRDVAERMGPMLDNLNGNGAPSMQNGRLHFATGGTVPVIEARSITQEQLLAAILAATQQQTQVTQQVAQNTGQTSTTVGAIAKDQGINAIPQWIGSSGGSGGGSSQEPSMLSQLFSSGLVSGGLKLGQSGANSLNFPTLGYGLGTAAGIATVVSGVQTGNPYTISSGSLNTLSSLALLVSKNPELAKALGISPGTAGIVGQALGAAGGAVGIVQGIQTGNYIGAGAGAAQTLGALANIGSQAQVANALGYSASTANALGMVGGGLGVVAGGLNIYQGIQSGSGSQVVSGAYSTLMGAYQLANLSGLFASTAPAATSTAAVSGGELALGAAAEGGAAAGGAASGAISAASAAVGYVGLVAAIAIGMWQHEEALNAARKRQGIIEGAHIRQAYADAVPKVIDAMKASQSLPTLAGLPAAQQAVKLGQIQDSLMAGWEGLKDVSHFISTKGVGTKQAISTIGRADTTQAEQLAAAATPIIVSGLARVADARALLSGGQYDSPVDIVTLLGTAAGSAGVGANFAQKLYGGQFANQLSTAVPGTFSQTLASILTSENPNFANSMFGQTLAGTAQFTGTQEQVNAAIIGGTTRNQKRIDEIIADALANPRSIGSGSIAGAYNPGPGILRSAGGIPYFAGGGNMGLLVKALGMQAVNAGTGTPGQGVAAYGHGSLDPYSLAYMRVEDVIPQLQAQEQAWQQYFGPNYGMAEGGLVYPNQSGMAGGGMVAFVPRPGTGSTQYWPEEKFLKWTGGRWGKTGAGMVDALNRFMSMSLMATDPGHYEYMPKAQNPSDTVPKMLTPGEFVVPRAVTSANRGRLESLIKTGRWGGGESGFSTGFSTQRDGSHVVNMGGISIHIEIHGDVKDEKKLVAAISPMLRDELKRIEPRYSRAGNKAQG